jgi:4-amino-4-deoxy-L-arabinose transferase-like glycosyltransferase
MSVPRPRRTHLLLVAIAGVVLLARLGDGNLANFDDGYYAQKAKEMIRGGDWITPHFAGQVRLDNPPLYLWTVAAGFLVFGFTTLGAQLSSALAGIGCVAMVMRLARRLGLDSFGAWGAGVILLLSPYFLKYSQRAMMDVALTLLFLVALDGYLEGCDGPRWGWVVLGAATGAGMLMKSVLGAFPLAVAGVHTVSIRRFRAAMPGLLIAAATAAAVGLPWFTYQCLTHGDRLVSEHFRWLIWSRGFVEPGSTGSGSDPFGYFTRLASVHWIWLPLVVCGLWLVSARAFGAQASETDQSAARLLVVWLTVVLGIMSAGHVKKLWYVMSIFPCLALLAASAVSSLVRSEVARRRIEIGGTAILAAAAILWATTPIGAARPREPDLVRMALAAKAHAPAGEKVVNLDADYWEIANQFLFYSDRDLTEPLGNVAAVRERVGTGAWALIDVRRVDEVVGDGSALTVKDRSGRWALVAAR